MTFLEMQDLALTWLDDPDAGYFSRTTIKSWINNAQKEVQKIIDQAFEGHFIKTVETTTVSGQREYQLPSDFKRLHRLEIVIDDGGGFSTESVNQLGKITPNQQGKFSRLSTPEAYFFKGKQIILVPIPDSAKTLRMDYSYSLADLVNDSDLSEIPVEHHEILSVYAAIDGFGKDGRDGSMMVAKRDEWIKMLKQDAEQRNADMSRTVVTQDDGDEMEGWEF